MGEDGFFDFGYEFEDNEEPQLNHDTVWIPMLHARDLIADRRLDSQFFFQFPAQGVARLFAFFNFSAGKFPFQWHGLVTRALAHQQLAIFFDHGGDDPFHKLAAVLTCSALATGSTQPVKVNAKAATPVEHKSSSSCSPKSWLSAKAYMRAESTPT